MEISILGDVRLTYRTNSIVLKKSKVGQMLALLAVRTDETVSTDTLIDELWERNAPRSVSTTLQTYVYHARKLFVQLGCADAKGLLVTRPPGYVLHLPDGELDAHRFARLIEQVRRHSGAGHDEVAVEGLSEALRLWRGPVFAGIPTGPVLDAYATYLHELRLSAVSQRIEARCRLGHYRELIPELRSLVAENPLNEDFHAQLIMALHRCGRRAEALQAYQQLWQILDAELGVRPSPEVQRLHGALVA